MSWVIRKIKKISRVTLGDWEVDRTQDCLNNDKNICLEPVQSFDIGKADVVSHENYERRPSNVENDIALIKLPRPAILNNDVQIACLPINLAEAAEQLNIPNIGDGLIGTYPNVVGWEHRI